MDSPGQKQTKRTIKSELAKILDQLQHTEIGLVTCSLENPSSSYVLPDPPALSKALLDIMHLKDKDALLREVRLQVSGADLNVIAAADYGSEQEANLAALRSIHSGHAFPAPLLWEPKEVCSLVRWDTPKSKDVVAHRRRLFACAVLLRAVVDEASEIVGPNQTAIIALESILVLGELKCVNAYIRWALSALDVHCEDFELLLMSIIIAAVLGKSGLIDVSLFGPLIRCACERWQAYTVIVDMSPKQKPKGLLDWTYYNQRHSIWGNLIDQTSHSLITSGYKQVATEFTHVLRVGPLL